MSRKTERVLGIDPGSSVTGWGIVEGRARIASGVLRLSSKRPFASRLRRVHEATVGWIEEFAPSILSLEKAFVARNVQSAFRLGEVRGVVLLAAAEAGLSIAEYAPAEVKQAVVGYGRADKEQMARGVALVLSIEEPPVADEADALAVAYCHACRSAIEVRAGVGR